MEYLDFLNSCNLIAKNEAPMIKKNKGVLRLRSFEQKVKSKKRNSETSMRRHRDERERRYKLLNNFL